MSTDTITNIERKRADAFIRIAQNAAGTTLAGAVPTPALELGKMLGIALSDAWMFWDVYKIYYNERLSAKRLHELLGDAGIIIFTGGVISYSVVRVSQSLINEALHMLPLLGWAVSGIIVGGSTLTIGLAWMAYVESRYTETLQQSHTRKVPIRVESQSNGYHPVPELAAEKTAAATASVNQPEQLPPSLIAEPYPERFLALNPDDDKEGIYVDLDKYELIREAILTTLRDNGEMLLKDLITQIDRQIGADFDGSVRWYVTTVKLDLEARNLVERIPDSTPQRLRLVE